MIIEEQTVIKILALALDNNTPSHRLEYLLKKLYGKDRLVLDHDNTIFSYKIGRIADSLRD